MLDSFDKRNYINILILMADSVHCTPYSLERKILRGISKPNLSARNKSKDTSCTVESRKPVVRCSVPPLLLPQPFLT